MAENKGPWQGIPPLGLVGMDRMGRWAVRTERYIFPDEMWACSTLIWKIIVWSTVSNGKAIVMKCWAKLKRIMGGQFKTL